LSDQSRISTAKIDLVLADRQWRCHPEAVLPRASANDVHREAAPQALCGHGRPERVRRSAALPVLDELESNEQAAAADVADLLVRRLELAQPPEQVLPLLVGTLDEPLLFDSLEHRETGGSGQRVGDVRGDVEEALPDTVLLDQRRDRRGEWDAAAERLRDGH
jgi:hypothetical protein